MLYQQILIEFWESGGNVWNLVTCDPIISVFIDQEQSLESNSGQIGPSVGVWVAVFQFYGLICDIGCCLNIIREVFSMLLLLSSRLNSFPAVFDSVCFLLFLFLTSILSRVFEYSLEQMFWE